MRIVELAKRHAGAFLVEAFAPAQETQNKARTWESSPLWGLLAEMQRDIAEIKRTLRAGERSASRSASCESSPA